MPGFLSLYSGTERVDLGDGWWVDLKRSLTHDEWTRVQAKLGAGRGTANLSTGEQVSNVDYTAYLTEMVTLSIADWNLTDETERVMRLAPEAELRRNVARLPAEVTTTLFNKCNTLNGPRDKPEAARFPEPPGDSGQERETGAPGTGVLPDPGGVLGPPGGDQGNPGAAALARRGRRPGGHLGAHPGRAGSPGTGEPPAPLTAP